MPAPAQLEHPIDLLPVGWLARLNADGYLHYSLTRHLGAASIPDSVLRSVGAVLAQLVPGTAVSDVTLVEPIPGSDYATLSDRYTPFHNDGLFLYKHPTYLLLLCDLQATTGGENYITRGDLAYQRLPADLLHYLQTHRIRSTMGDFSVARRWVDEHPLDGTRVVFFVDPLIQLSAAQTGGPPTEQDTVLDRLRQVIVSGERRGIRLAEGDLLILDNYRVLHAREKFEGRRRLRRVVVRHHALSRSDQPSSPSDPFADRLE